MSTHHIYILNANLSDDRITVEGEEAKHAVRVKRLRPGDPIRILDGQGSIALGHVESTGRELTVLINSVERAEPVRPAVHAWTATPKGPRIDKMIDSLVQAGAASWRAMSTSLGVVDPGSGKLDRVQRIAAEAAKQSQRPWLMEIDRKSSFDDALMPSPGQALVIADGSGSAYRPTGAGSIRVLIGPEGGFTPDELDRSRRAGAQVISLGPHFMRIELAAPIAVAAILAGEASTPRAGTLS